MKSAALRPVVVEAADPFSMKTAAPYPLILGQRRMAADRSESGEDKQARKYISSHVKPQSGAIALSISGAVVPSYKAKENADFVVFYTAWAIKGPARLRLQQRSSLEKLLFN